MTIHSSIGHEDWGKYASIFSLCFLIVGLSDLGINQFTTKTIASDFKNESETSSNSLALKIIATFIFPFLMVGISFILGYEYKWLKLTFIVATTHSLIQFFGYFRAQIQGYQFFKIDALTSNLDKIIFIIIAVGLLVFKYLTIWTFALSMLSSALLTCFVLFIISVKKGIFEKPKLDKTIVSKIIKKSLPFALITIVYSINERVDQVMVERLSNNLLGINDSSIYAAAYRLVNGIMMYLWIVLPIFFAKFAHHETDSSGIKKLLKIGTTIVFIPVGFISILSMFHGNLLFEQMFHTSSISETNAMQGVFSLLCITLLFQGMFAILSTFLTSKGHEKFVTKLVLISVVFNLLSNYFLIPIYGAYAAAWTTLGSAIIVIIGYISFILKHQLTELPYTVWIKLATVVLLSYIGYYLGVQYSTVLSVTLGMIIYIITILVLKPIRFNEIKNIN